MNIDQINEEINDTNRRIAVLEQPAKDLQAAKEKLAKLKTQQVESETLGRVISSVETLLKELHEQKAYLASIDWATADRYRRTYCARLRSPTLGHVRLDWDGERFAPPDVYSKRYGF